MCSLRLERPRGLLSLLLLWIVPVIASLPMYDWPEVRDATDAWWKGIARRLGTDIPLTRQPDHAALWASRDLLFSQTCGYPFTHALAGRLALVATPHYAADGCEGPYYRSIIFARRAIPLHDLRGATAAVNDSDSMSGMLALKLVFAPLARQGRFFGRTVWTGGHVHSLMAVRDGRADVCAVDAVCVGLSRRHRPELMDGLVEIARSPLAPGLPYVTVAGDVLHLRAALAAALADPDLADVRDRLLLAGHSVLDTQDYDIITTYEKSMEQGGGLELG